MRVVAYMVDQPGAQRIGDDVTGYRCQILFLAYGMVMKARLPDASSRMLTALINPASGALFDPSYQRRQIIIT